MAQQTAVNFLYQFVQLKLTHEQQIQYEGLFQQAKQMEKEQIIEAFDCDGTPQPGEVWISNGELYYNETYNK